MGFEVGCQRVDHDTIFVVMGNTVNETFLASCVATQEVQ